MEVFYFGNNKFTYKNDEVAKIIFAIKNVTSIDENNIMNETIKNKMKKVESKGNKNNT